VEPADFGIAHVPPEGVEALNRLADDVVATLTRVGIPARHERDETDDSFGAIVSVDTVADTAGGVFVRWRTPPELTAVTRQAIDAGDYANPDVALAAAVNDATCAALIRILAAAGMPAREGDVLRAGMVQLSLGAAS
jgi:hypothetical protein